MPCPSWADRVERGELRGVATRAAVRRRLAPLRRQRVQALVPGCTHYRFLAPLLLAAAGREARPIDTAPAVAARVAVLAGVRQRAAPYAPAPLRSLTTGSPAVLERQAARLLPRTKAAVAAIAI